jgi:trans-aconitate methyltransferase
MQQGLCTLHDPRNELKTQLVPSHASSRGVEQVMKCKSCKRKWLLIQNYEQELDKVIHNCDVWHDKYHKAEQELARYREFINWIKGVVQEYDMSGKFVDEIWEQIKEFESEGDK